MKIKITILLLFLLSGIFAQKIDKRNFYFHKHTITTNYTNSNTVLAINSNGASIQQTSKSFISDIIDIVQLDNEDDVSESSGQYLISTLNYKINNLISCTKYSNYLATSFLAINTNRIYILFKVFRI
jgi:hypothetical protein